MLKQIVKPAAISFVVKNRSYIYIYTIPKFVIRKVFLKQFNSSVKDELEFYSNNRKEIESQLFELYVGGLLECVLMTEEIPGDIIELGTYRGGSAIMIGRFLKRISSTRKLYACDTFEGHPYSDHKESRWGTKAKGLFADTNEFYVKDKFLRFGVAERIQTIKGKFEVSLRQYLDKKEFSLAFIDCDLYDSTKYALDFLLPRMKRGSIIAFDDYGSYKWGLSHAVNEQCLTDGFKVSYYPLPHITI